MHQPNCMERPLSAPSAVDHRHPSFPFSLPFAPSMAPITVPTHANVFLHFSVSNSFWLASNIAGGAHDAAVANSTTSFEEADRFAPAPSNAAMAPSYFFSSTPTSASCCPQTMNGPSGFDLLRSSSRHQISPVGDVSESITSAAASSGITSTDLKGRSQTASARVRLRILNPQKKRQQATSDSTSQNCASINVDVEGPVHSTPIEARACFGLPLGSYWHGLKKSRSKRRRFCTWGAETASSSQQESAIGQKCSSWCSNEDTVLQKASSSSIDAASCCITEVSTDNINGSVKRSGESDPDWADRSSWNGRDLTSKLDQLAFIACELKAKRRRSPRKQIRRHHYTTETFSPLTLIASYRGQNSISSCKQVAEISHTGSLSLARAKDSPFFYMRRPPLQGINSERAVSAPSAVFPVDRAAKCSSTRRVIRKAKTLGRQTRVQRCARQVLDFVGKDNIVREKLIRLALGNNPDTSKALRLLLDQRKLGRMGGGGRRDPYKYKLTPDGLHELYEKNENSNMLQLCSTASTSVGDEVSVDNPDFNEYNVQKSP